jgi:cell division protein FtsB
MDDLVITLDNNPGLVKKLDEFQEQYEKLERENRRLTIEVEVLERMIERLSPSKYD